MDWGSSVQGYCHWRFHKLRGRCVAIECLAGEPGCPLPAGLSPKEKPRVRMNLHGASERLWPKSAIRRAGSVPDRPKRLTAISPESDGRFVIAISVS